MSSINLYRSFTSADLALNAGAGYKPQIWFAPANTFTLVNQPATDAALGDGKTVSADDTFATGEGYISLPCKLDSVTVKGAPVGDNGAQQMQWTGTAIVLGDSSIHQEEFEDMLNDMLVILVKDQDCLDADGYVRFGDDCTQPAIKWEFDGLTTKDGMKQWTITWVIKSKRIWYSGTVTEKP